MENLLRDAVAEIDRLQDEVERLRAKVEFLEELCRRKGVLLNYDPDCPPGTTYVLNPSHLWPPLNEEEGPPQGDPSPGGAVGRNGY